MLRALDVARGSWVPFKSLKGNLLGESALALADRLAEAKPIPA